MTVATTSLPTVSHRAFSPSSYDRSRVVGVMTPDEYWAFERTSPDKHEYREGAVLQMAGASLEHNRISADLLISFDNVLMSLGILGEVLGSDQKVYIRDNKIVYPDLVVVVGEPQVDINEALRNPFLVVEVLSESTEKDDRTDKFFDYQSIESLRHYVLVDQKRVLVTHDAKQDNGLWAIAGAHRELTDTLAIPIEDKIANIPLSAIYRRVTFPDPSDMAPGA